MFALVVRSRPRLAEDGCAAHSSEISSGVPDNPTATGMAFVTTSLACLRATAGAASASARATSSARERVSGSNCAAFAAAPTNPNNWPASAARKAGPLPFRVHERVEAFHAFALVLRQEDLRGL